MKTLRIAALSLAALLLLLGAIVTWALCTESGTRSVLAIAQRWLPPAVSVAEVRGTVAGTLHIRNFRYHDPRVGIDLAVDSAAIDFAPFALLAPRLRVYRAQVDGVRLELSAATKPDQTPSTRNPWAAPLDMLIDDLWLTRGEWRRTDAPLRVSRAQLSGSWTGTDIVARQLVLESPDGDLSLSARLGSGAPHLQQLRGRFRWRAGEYSWAGALEANGARGALDVSGTLESPVNLRLVTRIAPGHEPDTWRTHVTVAPFDPHPLVSTTAFNRIGLELDAEGNARALEVHGSVSIDDERIHLERLALARREQMLDVTALRLRLNAQPAKLTGTATLALDGSKPLSARLAWDEVQLPDAWAGAKFRCAGQLAMTVGAAKFAVNGSARLARAQRQSSLAWRFDGTPRAVHIEEFELTQMPGSLSVTGTVDLGSPLRWQLAGSAQEFDPSLFFEQWPGALNFELRSSGDWPRTGPHARFELPRLAGRLRGRSISGSGDMTLGPDRKPEGRIQLQSGGASLQAVATRGAQPRFEARLEVAALGEWRKDIAGALQVEATALGRWPHVELDARLSGQQLRGGAARVHSARLHLIARDARAPRGKLELAAQDLDLAGLNFTGLSASLEGDELAHTLDLHARGATVSLALQASGAWTRGTSWSGTLARFGITVNKVPPLALAAPAHISVTRGAFELGSTCLKGGDIALCAQARQVQHEITANYSVQSLPLGMLVALAAPGSTLGVDGLLEGSGDLRRTAGGALTGKAALGSRSGAFVQGDGKDALRLEYRDVGVDLDLTPQAARAQLRGELLKQGNLSGALTVAVAEADPGLAGTAGLKLRDLAPLGWWMPQLANLRGSGELSAEVGGTLKAPRVSFSVRGSGLGAEVPLLGVQLREGNVDAGLRADGNFSAQGSISSGDGALKLGGARDAQHGLALSFTGSQFLAANVPGARVTVAPDLALTGKSGELQLAGSVRIESADVNLEKLSIGRSYRPSGDVVIVDRQVEVEDHSLGLATDVRVLFGDQVKLAGYGLDATVSGELRVIEERDRPGRATGEIVLAGTYEAFGRKLTIERGRLQFAGTALDDPQLDILAFRKIDEITAKLRVTGTAQNPKLDVFTDPAMSQTDAMSYLLTGKSASDLHGDEGSTVQSAAQSLGGVLGNRIAKKLGGKVGFVDQVGVEQNNDLGGSAFTVGKYLSPKLFVSYGVGLFEPGSAVTVRYEFSDRWSLEANDSPEDSHAGVRYRIEK